MRRTKDLTDLEKNILRELKAAPCTISEIKKKLGVNFAESVFPNLLTKYEAIGFLLFEEPEKTGSLRSRYGLLGVKEGSLAERLGVV